MIAIVGMACQYPDASSPRELWENVLTQRRAFRRFPSERLNLDDYFSSDRTLADAMYATEGAFIEGYEFDRVKFRVAGPAYRSADLVHWLALDTAARAIEDAGLAGSLPAESTGVIVGNTLTGEFSRAGLMRLRWPYVRRVLASRLAAEGWDAGRRSAFLDDLEEHYKAPFEPVGEETLAGGLSNTIGGRICNHFNLHGGGYSIDGACSSSLLAISQACLALHSGEMDAALAGGVDLSLDPFELIGFAKAGALAGGDMRVYDQGSSGFLPGEGCGFLLLMRHEDALERGLRCYALIRGWGISSDGGGGITRPEVAGQRLAVQRAYRRAGYGADSVALFEGHGTGTALGDEVELSALASLLGGARAPATIGSVKANIGHTKAAAGAAGMIKTVMALHTQMLPPNTGVERPHPLVQSGPLRILREGLIWPGERPLRAGVSSFGFGGINVHIALENPQGARRGKLSGREAGLVSSAQDAEVFLFGAPDRQSLAGLVGRVSQKAAGLSRAGLADLAAWLAARADGDARAAIVAATPRELAERLATLASWLAEGAPGRLDAADGLFLGAGQAAPRIAFIFPGQASPVRLDGGAMGRRFAAVRALYQWAELPQASTAATAVAQPAIVTAELAGLRLLECLGVEASLALGHSLGELTALHWAGAMGEDALLRIVKLRGQAMTDAPEGEGAMAGLAADAFAAASLIEGEDGVVIAGLNAPQQTVVSGEARAVAGIVAKAEAQGLRAMRLPVSHGFHSPLMKPAARCLAAALAQEQFAPLARRVVSTVTGAALPEGEDLAALLERQLTAPVRFTDALATALAEADLCLEVGPGQVASGLVAASSTCPVIALDCAGDSLRGLLKAVAAAFALGAPVDRRFLFDGRFTRPFDPDRPPKFFVNPCELAPLPESAPAPARPPRPSAGADGEAAKTSEAAKNGEGRPGALDVVRALVARRAELPASAVQDQHHLLRDLHLNSISIGQIIAEAARQLNLPPPLAPTEFANATLAEAAAALEQLRDNAFDGGPAEKNAVPAGLDAWVCAFGVEKIPAPPPAARPGKAAAAGGWRLFAPDNHPWAGALLESLAAAGGEGVLACLPPCQDPAHDALLLAAAHAALERDGSPRRFVLVQHGGIAGSFVRTLWLEARGLDACVVDVPGSADFLGQVLAEAQGANGFSEASYDAEGRRFEPALRPVYLQDAPPALPLSAADVLLVSGGGKGIAAECALDLARQSGVRLLLLGRANPLEDPELAGNLERFAQAGAVFRYARADVTDAPAVNAAVQAAQAELGPVTALLHGAGINQPCALARLDLAALEKTRRPKTAGLDNLLAAVDAQGLRLLVAFGSVIGRIGLHGEADYALANARLSRQVEEFQAAHPQCHCLSLEWSIWSGVGMGERLGRVEALLSEGITPITPDQGMDWLRRLVSAPTPSTSVVVSGRIGAAPPLRLAGGGELPFLRFLEHPRVHYPGVELVADAELSSVADPYLEDHVYQGERLLPAVIGLEAMVQAAGALVGSNAAPRIEAVELAHPIVVDAGKTLTLRVAALQRVQGRVEVALRCSQTAYQVDHFRAVCLYGGGEEPRPAALPPERDEPEYLPLSRREDLYGKLMFHTGRFRRLLGYWSLGAFHCHADIAAPDAAPWFARYLPQDLILGDPGSRDAAIHALQACIPHATILPVGLDLLVPGDVHAQGPWTVRAQERWQNGDLFCYDLAIHGADGALREHWEGLRLRRVAALPVQSWAKPLLLAYMERRLRELVPASFVAIALLKGPEDDRQSRAERALRRLLGPKAVVGRRGDGKPEAEGSKAVSVAHSGELTLAVASHRGPLACDLERIAERAGQTWHDLLGAERHSLAELIAQQAGEDFKVAATRVWAAIECLKKSGLPPNVPLTLLAGEADGWVLLGAGKSTIASFRADLENCPPRIFAVLA